MQGVAPHVERGYLSGPMTGHPEYNYPLFHAVAADLRAAGVEVVNPAENFEGRTDLGRTAYFRADLPQVAQCDNLFLLPGWRASRGVRYELIVAEACGLRVFEVEQTPVGWRPLNRLRADEVRTFTEFALAPQLFGEAR